MSDETTEVVEDAAVETAPEAEAAEVTEEDAAEPAPETEEAAA